MRAKATRKQALQEGSLAFLSAFLAAFLDSEAFCRGNVGHADLPFQCVDFLQRPLLKLGRQPHQLEPKTLPENREPLPRSLPCFAN